MPYSFSSRRPSLVNQMMLPTSDQDVVAAEIGSSKVLHLAGSRSFSAVINTRALRFTSLWGIVAHAIAESWVLYILKVIRAPVIGSATPSSESRATLSASTRENTFVPAVTGLLSCVRPSAIQEAGASHTLEPASQANLRAPAPGIRPRSGACAERVCPGAGPGHRRAVHYSGVINTGKASLSGSCS